MSGEHRGGPSRGWDDDVLRRLGPREPGTTPRTTDAPATSAPEPATPGADDDQRPAASRVVGEELPTPGPADATAAQDDQPGRRRARRGRRVADDLDDDLGPGSTLSPWESRRARRLARRPGTPTWRRRARVLTALVRSDDEPERRAIATATCQTAVSTGRRVAVVAAHGGAGATTLSVSLAMVLAGIRNDAVAVVAGAPDHGVLRRRIGAERPTSVREARDVLRARQSDPHNVPLEPFDVPGVERLRAATDADDPQVVAEAAEHLSRRHAVTFVDCGRADDHPVLTACHGVVVTGRQSLDGVAQVHDRLTSVLRRVRRERVLVVLLDDGADTGLDHVAAARLLARFDVPVMSVPPDHHLATGTPVTAALLGPRTAVVLTEVAARLLDVVTARLAPVARQDADRERGTS